MKQEQIYSLSQIKNFYINNIKPCTEIIDTYIDWLTYTNVISLSKFHASQTNLLDEHIAECVKKSQLIKTPSSDKALLKWLKSNNYVLYTRDFALDTPLKTDISTSYYRYFGDELFYKIDVYASHAEKLLSRSKSWVFAGLVFSRDADKIKKESCIGLVLGIHKLDSYVAIV